MNFQNREELGNPQINHSLLDQHNVRDVKK